MGGWVLFDSDLDNISFGADEGDAAILPIHQHLSPEVLSQQVLQNMSN